MSEDDNTVIREVRDARLVAQLRPLVHKAIEWSRDVLEPSILRGLVRLALEEHVHRVPPAAAVAFARGLTDLAVEKATQNFSEFDRGVWRGTVRHRLEGLFTMLGNGYYPERAP